MSTILVMMSQCDLDGGRNDASRRVLVIATSMFWSDQVYCALMCWAIDSTALWFLLVWGWDVGSSPSHPHHPAHSKTPGLLPCATRFFCSRFSPWRSSPPTPIRSYARRRRLSSCVGHASESSTCHQHHASIIAQTSHHNESITRQLRRERSGSVAVTVGTSSDASAPTRCGTLAVFRTSRSPKAWTTRHSDSTATSAQEIHTPRCTPLYAVSGWMHCLSTNNLTLGSIEECSHVTSKRLSFALRALGRPP